VGSSGRNSARVQVDLGGTGPPVVRVDAQAGKRGDAMSRRAIWGFLVFVTLVGLTWAAVRSGAGHRVVIDAVTGGGGAAVSGSWAAPQQAVGETAGFSQSVSYRNTTGVVQPVPGSSKAPAGWQVF
jgi:hypothetical protein